MTKSTARLRANLLNLPDPLLSSRRFLVWKYVRVEGKKPRKVPFYSSGHARGGNNLDTPEDLDRLTSLDEALAAAESLGFEGVGYAVVAGEGVGAFDLDACLTPDGELIEDHSGAQIAKDAEARGCYMEISPSGKGLHIFGPSGILEAYSKNDLEYWGQGRFLTVTGSVWANPKGWEAIEDLRASLRPPKERETDPEEEEAIVTRSTLEDLKSALEVLSSDERDAWVRIGMALKPLGKKGKALWLEWSAKSDKFDAEDAERVWESFRPERTTHKLIFNEAKAAGWKNPGRKRDRYRDDPDPDPEDPEGEIRSALRTEIDLGEQRLFPTEFVLDGFLPVGVTLVAGAWGAGKSTNLIPLFASAAHLTPEAWGFHPQLRRHVIWITEAPDQARDTLYSLSKDEGSKPWNEFKKWFHLIPARRRAPSALAKALEKAVGEITYDLEVDVSGDILGDTQTPQVRIFPVKPVVVLDTTSANLDLENESDNSEVGAAMAALKERLPGIPIVLVGHTPKALVKSDIADMTFRGAGAWEADAVATYYLVYDPDTDFRFMAIRKCRFTPDYTEISFGQEGGREIVDTPWGEPQSKGYMHGVPERSNGEERKAAQKAIKEEKKEAEKERGLTDRQTRVLEEVSKGAADGKAITKAYLREAVGGKAELLSGAVSRLLEGGLVVMVKPPADVLEIFGFNSKSRPPEILLPSEVDPEVFYETIRGRVGK